MSVQDLLYKNYSFDKFALNRFKDCADLKKKKAGKLLKKALYRV